MKIIWILNMLLITSCSLFGSQSEESPKYNVLVSDGEFEIREYDPFITAEVTMEGDYNKKSSDAFKVLAGYIFGDNTKNNKIAMTSPVTMTEESEKIAMTSPVTMTEKNKSFTMTFSMPSKYKMEDLPKPKDERIVFKQNPVHIIAAITFSGSRSKENNISKEKELRKWLVNQKGYIESSGYTYAGYNPPWTLPFLRRNEVHIKLTRN